jgi:hypothetical protein
MVVPENEYPAIDPIHSRMALYRAVENGFILLLHASNSLSLACDYQGRVYGLVDHNQAVDRVLVAQLPCTGVHTVYSRGGQELGNVAKGFENGFGVLVVAKRLYPEYSIAESVSAYSPKADIPVPILVKKQDEGCYILNRCKR